jgi:hypothetical protein
MACYKVNCTFYIKRLKIQTPKSFEGRARCHKTKLSGFLRDKTAESYVTKRGRIRLWGVRIILIFAQGFLPM